MRDPRVLPLVFYGSKLLRQKAASIRSITEEIRSLSQDMVATMLHHQGVGLAAPQVGKLVRMIVIRDERKDSKGIAELGPPEILLNPILSQPSSKMEVEVEGCLSLPKLRVEVARPERICVQYHTLEGKLKEEIAEGFRARVLMHENDHLNGVLIIDRASRSVRKSLSSSLRSMKKK